MVLLHKKNVPIVEKFQPKSTHCQDTNIYFTSQLHAVHTQENNSYWPKWGWKAGIIIDRNTPSATWSNGVLL